MFDVVVASNLFGDILSDLGPACTGTIAIAPSGNINPDRTYPSLFEPVHGSAPDIAGQGIANPIGQIWCAAMMLEHLGELEAGAAVLAAIEKVLAAGPGCAHLAPSASVEWHGTRTFWFACDAAPASDARIHVDGRRTGPVTTTCVTFIIGTRTLRASVSRCLSAGMLTSRVSPSFLTSERGSVR